MQVEPQLLKASRGTAVSGGGAFSWPELYVMTGGVMDEDLDLMSRQELIAESQRLRKGIREHRDSTGQELCWHHPALWGLLPEQQDPVPIVPRWPEFLRGCIRYRQSIDDQLPDALRSDEELEE